MRSIRYDEALLLRNIEPDVRYISHGLLYDQTSLDNQKSFPYWLLETK